MATILYFTYIPYYLFVNIKLDNYSCLHEHQSALIAIWLIKYHSKCFAIMMRNVFARTIYVEESSG